MTDLSGERKSRLDHRLISPGAKLVMIVIVSIALIMAQQTEQRLSTIRGVLSVALQPVEKAAALPAEGLDYLRQYADRGQLIRENKRLSQKVLLLQGQLQKFAALQAENERIRALLASAGSIQQKVLIAGILSVSQGPYRHYVKLNKGSADGVFQGQALIDAHGIMGQVTQVNPLSSRAELISDANNGIPVEINRTGLHTIAQGTGRSDRLTLPFLPINADIKAGDLLISSGLAGRYPPDYPVARVTQVVRHPGQDFLDVSAKPTAELNRGREALLVWNEPKSSQKGTAAGTASPPS